MLDIRRLLAPKVTVKVIIYCQCVSWWFERAEGGGGVEGRGDGGRE